jgi:DNA-directed RNA polymerase subunit L
MTTFTNIVRSGNKRLSMTINNTDVSIINSIRRIILSEIPNTAFHFDPNDLEHNDITINKNTCALHNEFLAHRISMVPLCFNENEINTFDPSQFKFVLKKQNSTYDTIEVTTKDIDIYDANGQKYPESLKERILPKNPTTKEYILLTKLKPNLHDEISPPRGEAIDLECIATLNNAMKHSRWSPVSCCSYGNTIDKDIAEKKFEEMVRKREGELGRSLKRDEKDLLLKRFNTLEVFRCFKKNKYDEADTFDFKLESECAMRCSYLFFKGCKILIEKLEKFTANLQDKEANDLRVLKLPGVPNFYQVEVRKENFTLMNVLQSQIYNLCMREMSSNQNVLEYIGYYQPHPLDEVMVMKIKFKTDIETDVAFTIDFLTQRTHEIIKKLKILVKEWISSTNDLKDIVEVQDFMSVLEN